MKLLALETATEACSAALFIDGALSERYEVAPRRHAELILPMIEDLLAEAQISLGGLDAIAFGRGPGAFTGVRIATGIVQGLAFGADLPVVPVSTLAALALGALSELPADATVSERGVLAAIDARMGEVYWGAYVATADSTIGLGVRQLGSELVLAPEMVTLPAEVASAAIDWREAGSGWQAWGEALRQGLQGQLAGRLLDGGAERLPRAGEVVRLGAVGLVAGAAVPAEQALPVYLRNEVAWTRPGDSQQAGKRQSG